MKRILFKGSATAIVTPFSESGNVDYNVLKELIDFQIINKTDALVVCGTTGESSTLTYTEKLEIIKFVVDYVNKRIPVIAGTGSNNTYNTIEISQKVQDIGADGILLVTPYYNKTSQHGLYKHYKYIANNVDLPIILYNVPSRTGMNISLETYLKLSEIDNIVATKEASGDLSHIIKIRSLCKDNLNVYSGNDDQIVPVMSIGGIGVISVLSNIVPRVVHDMCKYYLDGDISKSRELQIDYLNIIDALFSDVNPVPVKHALNFMGYKVGGCRLPLYKMNAELSMKMEALLKEYKVV